MRPVLVLRPEPGAGETAARARALGLEPIVAPLFAVRPIAWAAPDPAAYDAVMLTSANAARHGGDGFAVPGAALLGGGRGNRRGGRRARFRRCADGARRRRGLA